MISLKLGLEIKILILLILKGTHLRIVIGKVETGAGRLFIDNDIEYTIRDDLTIMCDDCDSIFIEIKRNEKVLTRKIIIGVIYRPDYVDLDAFYSDLASVFDVVYKEHRTCYITGDFNIDLLKFSSNNKISSFVNLIYSNNFFPCMDRPTRITEHSATLLYNILTNDIGTSTKISSVADITDHFPIFTTTCYQRSTNFNHQLCSKVS